MDNSEEAFIAVPMYARWLKSHPHAYLDWSISANSAHRVISDLATFIGTTNPVKHRIPCCRRSQYDLRCGFVGASRCLIGSARFGDRMQALGLEFMGPAATTTRC